MVNEDPVRRSLDEDDSVRIACNAPPLPVAEHWEKLQPERDTSVEAGTIKESAPPFPPAYIELNSTPVIVTLPGHTLSSTIPPFALTEEIEEKRDDVIESDERAYEEEYA